MPKGYNITRTGRKSLPEKVIFVQRSDSMKDAIMQVSGEKVHAECKINSTSASMG